MALLVFIFIALYIFISDSEKKAKAKEHWEKEKASGRYDETNPELHDMLWQDFHREWEETDGGNVPEEYREYLKQNETALSDYCAAWQANEEWKQGYCPCFIRSVRPYDKRDFDAFEIFRKEWGNKIKIFNETGKYYF